MLVATQGREASFHFVAARQYFGPGVQLKSCATFSEVLDSLGECDFGVVAVENSVSGAVHEVGRPDILVRRLIERFAAATVGEILLPIEQCLITFSGAKLEDITALYSHDAALKQCSRFLDEHLPNAKRIEHEDTAGAVADIKNWGDPHNAAIASRTAAELHGMQVLAPNIGNGHASITTFMVVCLEPARLTHRRPLQAASASR